MTTHHRSTPLLRRAARFCAGLLPALLAPVAAAQSPAHAEPGQGPATVVWISIDGLRWDYIQRAHTPTFDRLAREGAYTRALAPAFPTLTFPTHVSMYTGVPVSKHGIAANGYYDRRQGETLRYPPAAELLDAEPIWITAERQGVRTAVYDWPVSHQQRGPITASHFGQGYNARLSDDARLHQVIHAWRNDQDQTPLRLLMGYAVATDSPGHRYGPDAPEMVGVIEETDALLARFLEKVMELTAERLGEGDELYVVVTTDHGMSRVDFACDPWDLLGLNREASNLQIVTSGNIANVYLSGIEPESARRQAERELLQAARAHPFARAHRRADVPERLGYNHPDTVGDIVVILDRGYIFSTRADGAVVPIDEIGGPLGMHGYDVETNPEMYGYSVFWRYPTPLGGHDLGRVHYTQIHPTICAILGIQPAPEATGEPLHLEPRRTAPLAPARSRASMPHD